MSGHQEADEGDDRCDDEGTDDEVRAEAAQLLDRHGVPRHRVVSCAGRTLTNVAYDGRDLFITDAETGQILKARVPVPGRPLGASQNQGATA